jgi:hypothetical protein
MRSIRKLFTRLALVLVALAAFTAPVLAAAPSNDAFANAKLVTLGFAETIDTSEATTDADDAQLLGSCAAPATDASVWYALDGDGSSVIIEVFDSNYSAGLIVATGTQGNLQTVNCGPGYVGFTAEAGTRYYVLAFDDQLDGGGNGGTLSIAFSESVAPDLTYSVDEQGTLDASSGSATVAGSYTCTAGAHFLISVAAKRGKVVGHGDFDGECDGTPQRWTVVVEPEGGRFTDGKLQTTSFGRASILDQGVGYEIKQKVDLRSSK